MDFTVVPDEHNNEYTIPNTIPEHEGVYYCETYNEQGAVQSRQVNLTVIGTTVAQLAQYVTFNIYAVTSDRFKLNKNTQGAKKGEANQKQQLSSR